MSEYVFSCNKIRCCKYCPCSRYDFDEDGYFCFLLNRVIEDREIYTKAKDCLLTELPEHGDLIDRDELDDILSNKTSREARVLASIFSRILTSCPTVLKSNKTREIKRREGEASK